MSPRAFFGFTVVLAFVLSVAPSAQGILVNGPLLREPGTAGGDVLEFALSGEARVPCSCGSDEDERFSSSSSHPRMAPAPGAG
jgi:hypothetical protein